MKIKLDAREPYGNFSLTLGDVSLSHSTRSYDVFYFPGDFVRVMSYPLKKTHGRKFSISYDNATATEMTLWMDYEDTLRLNRTKYCRVEVVDLFGNQYNVSCVIPDLNPTVPEPVEIPSTYPINWDFFIEIAGAVLALILTFIGLKKVYEVM